MLFQLTYFLISSGVLACSDCFSKCSNANKNSCLLDCGCPLFTPSKVHGGSFQGASGLVYVPELNRPMADWVQASLNCDLSCSQQCSSQYLDSKLETCLNSCKCGMLMSQTSLNKQDSVRVKCENICKGSSAGCLIDCVGHIEETPNTSYLWVVFPALLSVFGLAWLTIRRKKEDDYVLM